MADRAGIRDRLRTAAPVFGTVHTILRLELERHANDFVALFKQKRGHCRGINSAAHATGHALALGRIRSGTLYDVRAVCKMFCRLRFLKPEKHLGHRIGDGHIESAYLFVGHF